MVDIFTLTPEQKTIAETMLARASIGAEPKKSDAINVVLGIIGDGKISDNEISSLQGAIKKIPEAASFNGFIDNPKNASEEEKKKIAGLSPTDPMQGLMMMLFSLIAQAMGMDPKTFGLGNALNQTPQSAEAFAAQNTLNDPNRKPATAPTTTTDIAATAKGMVNKAPEAGKVVTDEEKAIEYYTAEQNVTRLKSQDIWDSPLGSEYKIKVKGKGGVDTYIPLVDYDGLESDLGKEKERKRAFPDGAPEFTLAELDKKLAPHKEALRKEGEAAGKAEIEKIYKTSLLKYDPAKTTQDLDENNQKIGGINGGLRESLRLKTELLQKIADCKSAQEIASKVVKNPKLGLSNLGDWNFGASEENTYAGIEAKAEEIVLANRKAEKEARDTLKVIIEQEAGLIKTRLELEKENARLAILDTEKPKIVKLQNEVKAQNDKEAEAKALAEIAAKVLEAPKIETPSPASAASQDPSTQPSGNDFATQKYKLEKELADLEAQKAEVRAAQRALIRRSSYVQHGEEKAQFSADIQELDLKISSKRGEIAELKFQNNSTPENITKDYIESLNYALRPLLVEEKKLKLQIQRQGDAADTETQNKYAQVLSKIDGLQTKIGNAKIAQENLKELQTLPADIAAKEAEIKRLAGQIAAVNNTKKELEKVDEAITKAESALNGFNNANSLKKTDDEKALSDIKKELDTLQAEAAKAGAKSVAEKLGAVTAVITKAFREGDDITEDEMKAIKAALDKSGVKNVNAINQLIDEDAPHLGKKKSDLETDVAALSERMRILKESTDKAVNNYVPQNRPTKEPGR
jgi:hypothetical protein